MDKARDHAVSRADRIDQLPPRRAHVHRLLGLGHHDRAAAAHRHDDVPRAEALQRPRAGRDFARVVRGRDVEDFAQFVDVRFDQEGLKGKRFGQQSAARVHHEMNAFHAFQLGEKLRVDGVAESGRHASADDQPIAAFQQFFQLPHKFVDVVFRHVRARAVNIRFGVALDLYVDSALSGDGDKVMGKFETGKLFQYGFPRKSRDKTEGEGLVAQFFELKGYVDTLAAHGQLFARRTVDKSAFQVIYFYIVIQRRIESNRINHFFPYFGNDANGLTLKHF